MHACMHDGASWCGQNGHWCGQRRGLSLSACVTLIVQKMKPASFEYYPTPRFKKRTIQIQSSAAGAMAAMRASARALPWWVLPRVACVPRPCPAAPAVSASNCSARASLTSARTVAPCVSAQVLATGVTIIRNERYEPNITTCKRAGTPARTPAHTRLHCPPRVRAAFEWARLRMWQA